MKKILNIKNTTLIALSYTYQLILQIQLTAMSYFQKYQKMCSNSRTTNNTNQSNHQESYSAAEYRKNSQSRQSYLKAFKKYYIDKLMDKKSTNSQQETYLANKQNFCFHEPKQTNKNYTNSQNKSVKQDDISKPNCSNKKNLPENLNPKISRSKIVALVNNNDSQIQQLIYNSISQMQREMISFGEGNDLLRENKILKTSVEKMKLILRQKLKQALQKNKQELTLMFDQYSSMIKKLLQDKESMTAKLESFEIKILNEEKSKKNMEEQYQNKIRIIVQQNKTQISHTKQQIEQFLDMIIQYQQETNNQKQQLEKLREKVVELQMENDRLKRQNSSSKISSDSFQEMFQQRHNNLDNGSTFRNDSNQSKEDEEDEEDEDDEQDQFQNDSEVLKYAEKIEKLLNILDKLQEENKELNEFLKTCKCSRIRGKDIEHPQVGNINLDDIKRDCERKLITAEKQYIKQQMFLREAIKKKDQCIERLNLVIAQMRKQRYESVDRMTQNALQKQKSG